MTQRLRSRQSRSSGESWTEIVSASLPVSIPCCGSAWRFYTGHTEEVRAAAFVSADRIVSIIGDSTARLWDAWSGKCLRKLDTNPLYVLADDPSRGRLVVAGGRGNVRMLDRLTLQVMATF